MNDGRLCTRRDVVVGLSTIIAGSGAGQLFTPNAYAEDYESKRPPVAERKFLSQAIDTFVRETQIRIGDPALAWLFGNCFPNTLDTTVEAGMYEGKPDTAVITGDIPAMWLRDSCAQVWPYLPFARGDEPLRRMFEGLFRRQAIAPLEPGLVRNS